MAKNSGTKQAQFEPFEGESKGSGSRHSRITRSMIVSLAWKKTKPIAAKLYVYIKLKYRGGGELTFSCTYKEVAAFLGFSDRSIKAAFSDLIQNGFIEVAEDNHHRMKPNVYRFSARWQALEMQTNQAQRRPPPKSEPLQ